MKHIKQRMKLRGGYVLASGADMCVFAPRVRAADPVVEALLQDLEGSGASFVTRLGPDAIVDAEQAFEDVIKQRALSETTMYNTTWVSDGTVTSVAKSKPIMQAEDLEKGRISIQECSRIKDIVKTVGLSKTLPILDTSFTALQQAKYNSNWDPDSENNSPVQVRQWATQILRVLSRFADPIMPCILVHQDIHLGNLAILNNGRAALVDFGRSSCINTKIDLDRVKSSVIQSYEKLFVNRNILEDNQETLKQALRDAVEDGRASAGAQQDLLHAFAQVALQSEEPRLLAEKYKPIFVNAQWPVMFVESMSDRDTFVVAIQNLFAPRDTLQFMSTLKEFLMEAGISKNHPEIMPIMNAMKNLEESYIAQQDPFAELLSVFRKQT